MSEPMQPAEPVDNVVFLEDRKAPSEEPPNPPTPEGPPPEIAAIEAALNPLPPAIVVNPVLQSAALSTTLNPRLAPQDLHAERSVLGGIILTNESLFEILELVRPADFYREQHRKIFAAMCDMAGRNEAIDLLTLADELRKRGDLESVDGAPYIASLDADVPATANLRRYAKIIRDKALGRLLIEQAHVIAREGYEQIGEIDDLVDRAQTRMLAIERRSKNDLEIARLGVRRAYATIERLYDRGEAVTGTATGFVALDQMTAGLQPGDLIVIAGRPSMGKTSLAMNIAGHVALEGNRTVAVFSLEMSTDSLMQRLLSSEGRIDGHRLRTGRVLDSDWPKLARAADRIYKSELYIDDSSDATVNEIRAKCRRLKSKRDDLALVVIDYLQLLRGTETRHGEHNRQQEIAEITRGLKGLAKDLRVPVIALSQLNRGLERREDKRPTMADLRESGAIEQDSDVIAFVHREEIYRKDAEIGVAEIIIAKQRNGATGTMKVAFLKDYTRFENLAPEQSFGGGGHSGGGYIREPEDN